MDNIKLRGSVIDLIVKQAEKNKNYSLFNPDRIVRFNTLFSSLNHKYDSKTVLNKLKTVITGFNNPFSIS